LLIALAWAIHPHHQSAHTWFARQASAGWATCLLTQSSFLRLSLNPKIVATSLDSAAAHSLLVSLVADPHHQFVDQGPAIASSSFAPLLAGIRGYRQVPDAVLLYVAKFHGLNVVTFDQALATQCTWAGGIELLVP
jgi:toxin-antitoxin system PIN domain toxin